jgi:hypothetical protein
MLVHVVAERSETDKFEIFGIERYYCGEEGHEDDGNIFALKF